jgi:hypothetical protein
VSGRHSWQQGLVLLAGRSDRLLLLLRCLLAGAESSVHSAVGAALQLVKPSHIAGAQTEQSRAEQSTRLGPPSYSPHTKAACHIPVCLASYHPASITSYTSHTTCYSTHMPTPPPLKHILRQPLHPARYELCAQYGLYVIDEANIETHGFDPTFANNAANPANSPLWAAAMLDRGLRMYERDKNCPAVIMWSLGNEAGYGPGLAAMAGWLRAKDPSRPVHYEVGCAAGAAMLRC